jgi:hypothetical protein
MSHAAGRASLRKVLLRFDCVLFDDIRYHKTLDGKIEPVGHQ